MMNETLEVAFNSMVSQSEFENVMSLISGISVKEMPPPTVINNLIFNVLMKNCEQSITNEAIAYLDNFLRLLPKLNPSIRYDYREVLLDKSGVFEDIWSVFLHLLESSFRHYNISSNKTSRRSEFVKYPNCEILVDFYGKMLIKFLSLENDFFNDSEERFLLLLDWINKIYKLPDPRVPVLDTLHTFLDKKLSFKFSSIPFSPENSAYLNLILEKCPNVFNSALNMKGFFARSNLPYFKIKICQHKLHKLIYKRKLQESKLTPLTLKTILRNYFFLNNTEVEVKRKTRASSKIDEASKKSLRHLQRRFFPEIITGETSLHEFCRKNRFGDLFEVLSQHSYLRPNVRNSAGRTPLHDACLYKSYYCVKFLLEYFNTQGGDQVDLKAVDKLGLTPLHCAVYVNAVHIAQMLLKYKGAELLTLEDEFGEKPIAYAESQEMKDLLESYEFNIQDLGSNIPPVDSKYENLTFSSMKDKEEYLIYLYGLSTVVSNYLESFNLYSSEKDNVKKMSHKHSECAHYVSLTETVCDEDASVFASLPLILNCFLGRIENYANEIGVDLHFGLLPLTLLSKRLAIFLNNCYKIVQVCK